MASKNRNYPSVSGRTRGPRLNGQWDRRSDDNISFAVRGYLTCHVYTLNVRLLEKPSLHLVTCKGGHANRRDGYSGRTSVHKLIHVFGHLLMRMHSSAL